MPMPAPTSTPLPISCRPVTSGKESMRKANHEATQAGTNENSVRPVEYATGAGSSNASIPMKCVVQMPPPNAIAPVKMAMWRYKAFSVLRAICAVCNAMVAEKIDTHTESSTKP